MNRPGELPTSAADAMLERMTPMGSSIEERLMAYATTIEQTAKENDQLLLDWVKQNQDWHFFDDHGWKKRLLAIKQSDDNSYTLVEVKILPGKVSGVRSGVLNPVDYVNQFGTKVIITHFSQSSSRKLDSHYGLYTAYIDEELAKGNPHPGGSWPGFVYTSAHPNYIGEAPIIIPAFPEEPTGIFRGMKVNEMVAEHVTSRTLYLRYPTDSPFEEEVYDEEWENQQPPEEDPPESHIDYSEDELVSMGVVARLGQPVDPETYFDDDPTNDVPDEPQTVFEEKTPESEMFNELYRNIQSRYATAFIRKYFVPRDISYALMSSLDLRTEVKQLYSVEEIEQYMERISAFSGGALTAFHMESKVRNVMAGKPIDWHDPEYAAAFREVMGEQAARLDGIKHRLYITSGLYGHDIIGALSRSHDLLQLGATGAAKNDDKAIYGRHISPQRAIEAGSIPTSEVISVRGWVEGLTEWQQNYVGQQQYLAMRMVKPNGEILYADLLIDSTIETAGRTLREIVGEHADNVLVASFSQSAVQAMLEEFDTTNPAEIPTDRLHLGVRPGSDPANMPGYSSVNMSPVRFLNNI